MKKKTFVSRVPQYGGITLYTKYGTCLADLNIQTMQNLCHQE